MSSFFAQLLISIVLTVSAAAGFSPDVREKVAGTFHEAQALFETAANVEANAEASAGVDIQPETGTNPDLNKVVDDVSDLVPSASVDSSASVKSETDINVESDGASLNLENTLKNILDLGIGIGE